MSAKLTYAELKTLKAYGRGLTAAQIAAETGQGLRTVQTHLLNIRIKFNARNRIEMVVIAAKKGIL
jgi:DNA-binding CsgD family transcriptional regulator